MRPASAGDGTEDGTTAQGYATEAYRTEQGCATEAYVGSQGYAIQVWVDSQDDGDQRGHRGRTREGWLAGGGRHSAGTDQARRLDDVSVGAAGDVSILSKGPSRASRHTHTRCRRLRCSARW
jgi:hypothetical protein